MNTSTVERAFQNQLRTLLGRIAHNWNVKIGAFLLASLLWALVSRSAEITLQATFEIPVEVTNTSPLSVTTGIPETVEVSVSGQAARVRSLKPEQINAYVNMDGVSGSFTQEIIVIPPQDIQLKQITPATVQGVVRLLGRTKLPVRVSLLNLRDPNRVPDHMLSAVATPREVVVEGPAADVGRASAAVATYPYDPEDLSDGANYFLTSKLFVVDENGNQVKGVTLDVPNARITLSTHQVLYQKRLPLKFDFIPSPMQNLKSAVLNQSNVLVVGPREVIDSLKMVIARVGMVPSEPGRYTLRANLELPPQVHALEDISVTVWLESTRASELFRLAPVLPDGSPDDAASPEDTSPEDTSQENPVQENTVQEDTSPEDTPNPNPDPGPDNESTTDNTETSETENTPPSDPPADDTPEEPDVSESLPLDFLPIGPLR